MSFKTDPLEFITGDERGRAKLALECYFRSYTGSYFERFLDSDHPDEFTAMDFLAVSMLSVTVPAKAAIWMMNDGREEAAGLLSGIGTFDLSIADARADLSSSGPAQELWRLLRRRRWPEGEAASGLGRTILSKLLAAKRPYLIPVYDKHVAAALFEDVHQDAWALWQERFQEDAGRELQIAAESLRLEAKIPPNVSALRVLDVSIWMRVHGYRFCSDERVLRFADAPKFWAS